MLLAAAGAAGAVLLTTHDESNKGIRQEQNLREVCQSGLGLNQVLRSDCIHMIKIVSNKIVVAALFSF